MNKSNIVYLFTRNGLGDGPLELQKTLVLRFIGLLLDSEVPPAKLLFYTAGVKLLCEGSPIIDGLQKLQDHGVEIIACKTCIDFYNLENQMRVGIIGSMADFVQTFNQAEKVISI